MRVLAVVCLLLLVGCGDDATGRGGDAGADSGLGAACTPCADDGGCASCPTGLVCFKPLHDVNGFCTHVCQPTYNTCGAGFMCDRSALDDYATGPWCLGR
jgi:hypothetical protein